MKHPNLQPIHLLLLFVTLFSFFLHFFPIHQAGFPVNDGGLFYSMTLDLLGLLLLSTA